ncbi:MAG: hypothetical protein R3B54_01480 [Bdellovibrionota bacterium]
MRLEELTGAKRLVQAFVSLAMPNATETDEAVYSLLFGAEQLIDFKSVSDGSDEAPFTFWGGDKSISNIASQRLTKLKSYVHEQILAKGYHGQSRKS